MGTQTDKKLLDMKSNLSRTGKGKRRSREKKKRISQEISQNKLLHFFTVLWIYNLHIPNFAFLKHTIHSFLVYLQSYAVIRSVQFSGSVMSDSLQPQGLQHARLPSPSPTPGPCSNSCPSSCWCHPTISSSVVPFSSSFPSIRVFSNESVLCIRWPKY